MGEPVLSQALLNEIDGVVKRGNCEGLALGVIVLPDRGSSEKAKVTYHGCGLAGPAKEVDEKTVMHIASNSKLITSAAVGLLVQDGLIKWTSKLSSLLPGLSFHDPVATSHLTLLDLLSHHSGLPRHDLAYSASDSLDTVLGKLAHAPPAAEIRQRWMYGNLTYTLAAKVVEAHDPLRRRFTQFVEERLLQPLGMKSSSYTPELEGVTKAYAPLKEGGRIEIPVTFQGPEEARQFVAGPAGLASSVDDMLKWAEALINAYNGEAGASSPLKSETVKMLAKGHSLLSDNSDWDGVGGSSYGLGVELQSYRLGRPLLFHGGGIPGFGSHVAWSPEGRFGVVVLCNTAVDGSPLPPLVGNMLCDHLLRLPKLERTWEEQYKKAEDKQAREALESRQKRAAAREKGIEEGPTLESGGYEGVYEHPGYGRVIVGPSFLAASSSSFSARSPAYAQLATAQEGAQSGMGYTLPPTLHEPGVLFFEGGKRMFDVSHLHLVHERKDTWQATVVTSFGPVSGGKGGATTFWREEEESVTFVVEAGKVRGLEVRGITGAPGTSVTGEKDEEPVLWFEKLVVEE